MAINCKIVTPILKDYNQSVTQATLKLEKKFNIMNVKKDQSPINPKEAVERAIVASEDPAFARWLLDTYNTIIENPDANFKQLSDSFSDMLRKSPSYPVTKANWFKDMISGYNPKVDISFLTDKQQAQALEDAMSGVYKAEDIQKENPLTNIVAGIATLNSHREAPVSQALAEALGFPNGIVKAYIDKDPEAIKFVETFRLGKEGQSVTQAIEKRDALIETIYEKMYTLTSSMTTPSVRKEDNTLVGKYDSVALMKKEMSPKDKQKLVSKFYNISQLENYTNMKQLTTEKFDGQFPQYKTLPSEGESILQKLAIVDHLTGEGMDLKLLKPSRMKDFETLSISVKHSGPIRDYISNVYSNKGLDFIERLHKKIDNNRLTFKDVIGHQMEAGASSLDYYAKFLDIINTPPSAGTLNSNLSGNLRSTLQLPDDYVFVGGFGDKDNLFSMYTSPLVSKKRTDYYDELQRMYDIEYTLKGFFRKNNSITWKDFQTQYKETKDVDKTKEYFLEKAFGKDYKEKIKTDDAIKAQSETLFGEKLTAVNKRGGSMQVSEKTFHDLDMEVTGYHVEKYSDSIYSSLQIKLESIKGMPVKEKMTAINDLYNLIKREDPDIENSYFIRDIGLEDETGSSLMNPSNVDQIYKNFTVYIKDKVYGNDFNDGWSLMTPDIHAIRKEIRGVGGDGLGSKDIYIHRDPKSQTTTMVKSYWNNDKVLDENGEEVSGLFFGDSSVKLGKDQYVPFTDAAGNIITKTYTINGEKYIIKGTYPRTNLKNMYVASADTTKQITNVTLPVQAFNKLPPVEQKEIRKLLLDDVNELVLKYKRIIGTKEMKVNPSTIEEMIGYTLYLRAGLGGISDTVLSPQLRKVVADVIGVADKPQYEGGSGIMKYSRRKIGDEDISRNDLIASKENPYFKNLLENKKDRFLQEKHGEDWKIQYNADAQSKIDMDAEFDLHIKTNPIYVVNYRSPIPNVENLAILKVRFIDEIDSTYKLGKKEVITHPETTFMKLEADHDVDKTAFFSIDPSDNPIGDVLARGVLYRNDKALYDTVKRENISVRDYISRGNNINNRFLIVPEPDGKDAGKDIFTHVKSELTRKNYNTLVSTNAIGVVMSSVRSLDILLRMHDSYKKGGLEPFEVQKIQNLLPAINEILVKAKMPQRVEKVEDFFELFNMNALSPEDINYRKYSTSSSTIAQETLDAAKYDNVSFDKKFVENLLKDMGIQDIDFNVAAKIIEHMSSQKMKLEKNLTQFVKGDAFLGRDTPSLLLEVQEHAYKQLEPMVDMFTVKNSRRFMYERYGEKIIGRRPYFIGIDISTFEWREIQDYFNTTFPDGNLSNYFPEFFQRYKDGALTASDKKFIVETGKRFISKDTFNGTEYFEALGIKNKEQIVSAFNKNVTDIIYPQILGKIGNKDMRLQDYWDMLYRPTQTNKGFVFIKTNLHSSISQDRNRFITSFSEIKEGLTQVVEDFSNPNLLSAKGIQLSPEMNVAMPKIKSMYDMIEEMNTKVRTKEIKLSDVVTHPSFHKAWAELDSLPNRHSELVKSFVSMKLIADGHQRMLSFLSQADKINYYKKVNDFNKSKIQYAQEKLNKEVIEGGYKDGRINIGTTVVKLPEMPVEEIIVAKDLLESIVKEKKEVFVNYLSGYPNLMKELGIQANGDGIEKLNIESLDEVIRKLQSNCN